MPQTQHGSLGLLVWGFIVVIIGINLLTPIANTIKGNDVIDTNNNKTLTFANNTVISLGVDNVITDSESVWAYVVGTPQKLNKGSSPNPNYTINYAKGDISFINATPQNWYNNSASGINVSFRYEGDNYVADSTARVIENLTIIFAAIAIFVVGVFIVTKALESFL